MLYEDDSRNLVIIQSPTLWNTPKKSDYEPQQPDTDGTVDSDTMQEVTEFLETFFTFYPTATEKELAYYVKNNTLPPIEKNYIFSNLINPIIQQDGERIRVWLSVEYIDEATKAIQNSQYVLTLIKETNWMVVD